MIGVVLQDSAAQHWRYNTLLAANIILNTSKIAEMVDLDFHTSNNF